MHTHNEPETASKETTAAATPTPIAKADYETLAGFRYALRLFLRFSEEEAYRDHLTPQQHQLLLAIQGFPGRDFASIGELAERLQLRQHSVVGLVNRLTHAGLAVREPDLKDRRKVFVRLTPAGFRILENLALAHRQELHRIQPQLLTLLTRLGITYGAKTPGPAQKLPPDGAKGKRPRKPEFED